MITLCMDTSHKHLTLVLIQDDKIINKISNECFKQQSESIFPELIHLCDEVNIKPDDIDQVVVTRGPGSYTGVRIAMTVAKVLCATKNIPCYSLSTLQLYSGNHSTCCVLLDARSKRAYFAKYNQGKCMGHEGVYTLDEIREMIHGEEVLGDGSLLDQQDQVVDLAESFLALKPHWQKVDNIHCLVPEYLKASEDYLVK